MLEDGASGDRGGNQGISYCSGCAKPGGGCKGCALGGIGGNGD